ncbi:MAG: ferredoxin-thioredoxin reductase catalytic domain-containing protein [Candidatus Hydrothermarchaeota archaeon]
MKAVEDLYNTLKIYAEKTGYTLNPDWEILSKILEGLLRNEERYGYRSCPCRMASGVLSEDRDIICPCDYRDPDLDEYGRCLCTLYVTDDYIKGKKKYETIPDRRPIERYLKSKS